MAKAIIITAIGLLSLAIAATIMRIGQSSLSLPEYVFALSFGIGAIATGVGLGLFINAYRNAWQNKTESISRPSMWVKVGLLVLGIAAAIFTIEYIWVDIEIRRQAKIGIYYPDLIFQWPLRVFFTISEPSILFQLPALGYVEFLIAFISPILAVIAARKLQYPPVYHLVWFILALLFPFLLIILAFVPRYSIEIGERLEAAAYTFLGSIFL
jgi:NADH:ubiquinone oxidoreductase subunit K